MPTKNDSTLEEYLEYKAHDRQERYKVMEVDFWPKITDFETVVFLGMYSWTMPVAKRRILLHSSTLDRGYGVQTPTEITRDYLDYHFPVRLRASQPQRLEITKHRAFPCFAEPCTLYEGAYIDIKSAYWNIISAVGWDVDYWPGKFLGVSSTLEDFPLKEHKAARSSLVTSGLSSPIRMWTGSGLKWKQGNNIHINYGLWAYVQDVLHGVAFDMLSIGAKYIHTDGYILPHWRIPQAIEIIESWGLTASIKAEGPTEIYGVGGYRVGEATTRRKQVRFDPNIYRIEDHPYRDWLRAKTRFWQKRKESGKGIDMGFLSR